MLGIGTAIPMSGERIVAKVIPVASVASVHSKSSKHQANTKQTKTPGTKPRVFSFLHFSEPIGSTY